MLHAWRLRFHHPSDGRDGVYEAPVPPDMAAVLAEAHLPLPSEPPTFGSLTR